VGIVHWLKGTFSAYDVIMPKVFLLSDDLMTTSRVRGAGPGIDVRHAGSLDSLAELLESEAAGGRPLIVLDLQTRGIDWASAIGNLKPLGRLLAFGPHVWQEQLNLARQSGCDLVLTNGEFYGRLDRWLSGNS
jgi:hypothetical protein